MKLFGFTLSKNKKEVDTDSTNAFVPELDREGSIVVPAGSGAGYFGQFVDIDGNAITNERELILKYRDAAIQPECDSAISDIVNAAIISDDDSAPVSLITNDLELNDSIKKKITEEFEHVVSLLNFNEYGYEYFRNWYIDGRIYFNLIVDEKKSKNGIHDIREIDPTKIKKVKEVEYRIDKATGAKTIHKTNEYFQYSESLTGINNNLINIGADSIVYVPSGLLDPTRKTVISNLHKALKIVNNLKQLEDSLIIYRISRAPERRIFYIDVGNLPKGKAEEYVQSIMSKYRNKLVYDASTGDIRDDRKSMSMLEDFWLPRKEGGRGTEITTLPGGDNLGQIDDVVFFQKKLYKALNVPISRLESETGFNIGRASEISRDEVKFHKFISRLRKKFSYLLLDILKVQLLLKGIITEEDWKGIRENISVDFAEDNYFSELKEFEILRERLNVLNEITPHVGKFFSQKWVRTNILRQSDQDIERIEAEIAEEQSEQPENDQQNDIPEE